MTYTLTPELQNFLQDLPKSETTLAPDTLSQLVLCLEKLTQVERLIFTQMYQFNKRLRSSKNKWKAIFPSIATIAKSAGVCERSVQNFLRKHFNLQPYKERWGERGQLTHEYTPMMIYLYELFKQVEGLGIFAAIRKGTKAFRKKMVKLKKEYYKQGSWEAVVNLWTSLKQRKVNDLHTTYEQDGKIPAPPPPSILHPMKYPNKINIKEYFCSTFKVPSKVFDYIDFKLREGKEALTYMRNTGIEVKSEVGLMISKLKSDPVKKVLANHKYRSKRKVRFW